MRKSTVSILVISIVLVVISLVPSMWADDRDSCSTSSVAGDWAATLNGTLFLPTGPVPGAAVIRASADAEGNISGGEARNVGGGFANETLQGTWTVNSDCTGTATVNIYESGVLVRISVLAVVFSENSKHLRMLQQSLTLPNDTNIPVVITAEGEKLFPTHGS